MNYVEKAALWELAMNAQINDFHSFFFYDGWDSFKLDTIYQLLLTIASNGTVFLYFLTQELFLRVTFWEKTQTEQTPHQGLV